jgi:hypothetical protein
VRRLVEDGRQRVVASVYLLNIGDLFQVPQVVDLAFVFFHLLNDSIQS